MKYITKWRKFELSPEQESSHDSMSHAERFALDLIGQRYEDVWIEDDSGHVVLKHKDLKLRLPASAKQSETGRIAK